MGEKLSTAVKVDHGNIVAMGCFRTESRQMLEPSDMGKGNRTMPKSTDVVVSRANIVDSDRKRKAADDSKES